MTQNIFVGGTEETFKFTFLSIALVEQLLKVNLSSNETDPRVFVAIREGAQKLSDYLLRSAARPPTLTRQEGADEEDLREALKEFAQYQEVKERAVDFTMKAEDSFRFDLGIVQEQLTAQDEDEAFFYLINFIFICDLLEKNGGAIHIYVSGEDDHVVVDEVTPWCDIRCQGNIAYTPMH